jgi:hypothetical protein
MIKIIELLGTTATGGAVTIKSGATLSKLLKVQWVDGDLSDGVDAVLSVVNSDHTETILTLTDANADAMYSPRTPIHTPTGAAITYDGTRVAYDKFILAGQLQLAITAGGDAHTGGMYVFVEVE